MNGVSGVHARVIVYIIDIITNIIKAFVKGELNILLSSRYLIKSIRLCPAALVKSGSNIALSKCHYSTTAAVKLRIHIGMPAKYAKISRLTDPGTIAIFLSLLTIHKPPRVI